MKIFRFVFVSIVFLFAIQENAFCQDSLKVKSPFIPRKNVIRYNITPHILGFKSTIFGYERVVKPYQTFSINAGYIGMGDSGSEETEDVKILSSRKSRGFNFAGDYRFYLKKENIDPAPHGVYLAPFFSFYSLTNQNQIQPSGSNDPNDITTIDARMDILNIGASLGYQFNIKNRFSIDMVLFGPSIASYKLNMDFNSGFLPPDDEWSDGALALRDYLFNKHPWLETLVDEGDIDVNGKKAFWGFGFRYVVQVGYRF